MGQAAVVYGVLFNPQEVFPGEKDWYDKIDEITWENIKYREDNLNGALTGHYDSDENMCILHRSCEPYYTVEYDEALEITSLDPPDTGSLEELCNEFSVKFEPKWYLYASEG